MACSSMQMWSSMAYQVLDHRCAAALGAVPHMMLACCAAGRQGSLDVTCCHGCPAQVSRSFPARADGRRDPPEPTVRGALFFLQQLAESAGKHRFSPLRSRDPTQDDHPPPRADDAPGPEDGSDPSYDPKDEQTTSRYAICCQWSLPALPST